MVNKTGEELLEKMLSIIRKNPGIRLSEINRLLDIPYTWDLRKTLLKSGLIRKEKDGSSVRYYIAF